MKYIIAGAGPAGVIAAETLRKADPRGSILVIGDEPEPPYSRMAIPYLLSGGIGEDGTILRKRPGHYKDLRIRILRDRVAKVHPKKRQITLAGGGKKPFDRLLIATGASAVKPKISGLSLPGVHHCWTAASARTEPSFANGPATTRTCASASSATGWPRCIRRSGKLPSPAAAKSPSIGCSSPPGRRR